MIFTTRYLTRKSIEHWTKHHLIFVDLKKAYDSVPLLPLLVALRKLGVTEHLIDVIIYLNDNMKAKLEIDGEMLREIEVENYFQQDCTMAHVLFNIYACVMAEKSLERVCDVEGVVRCLFTCMMCNSFKGIPEMQVKVCYTSVSLLMM